MRRLPLIFLVAIAAAACSDDKPVGMADIDVEHTPTMLTRNVETLISDSGITRFRITAPVWYIYDETATPVWRFPESLLLERFGDHMDVEATVRADSATYFKERQLWRLDGHVRISNTAGEKFLTNQLFWDQKQHKVYSDSFIHIERIDKTLEGHGFTSDEQLTRYTIRDVSGIFPAASFAAPADRTPERRDTVK
ncbi:MAG: LPS export ABC transporter periplasmic protein LptC [Bacteroides sp.]|nr:LPS export ABC transporter periplasmic protein LptC [Bacteroidales bacterium]MBD5249637.1 LPS export ABC transporter periplasmic protein LptC [Barnesiella sp.]MBD5345040.1 LPS export ABC transporter periplasmic protein LptC [Bacteroides sp.]MDE5829840.1 LPS export ABC transporter periplasmic protein LptC [Duncaniella sp.]MBD5252805.1 LPS export ABC transporter periplasmic protein LptC [Barnesiella sp.]